MCTSALTSQAASWPHNTFVCLCYCNTEWWVSLSLPKQVVPDIDYNSSAVSFLRDKIWIFKYFLDEPEALLTSCWYNQENRLKSSAISVCPFSPFTTLNTSQGYFNMTEISEGPLHTFWDRSVPALLFLRDEQTVTLKYTKLFPSPLSRKLHLVPMSRILRLSCRVPNLLCFPPRFLIQK